MKGKAMTPKQERFVAEYIVDLCATKAARRAGYSEKTARFIGAENLSKPNIAAAIAAGQAARSERTEITQDYVLAGIVDTVERCQKEDGYNPQAALKGLELLGRHLAMFTDRTDNRHTFEHLTDAEVDEQLAAFDRKSPAASRKTH